MIWAVPVLASPAPALRSCWRRSARVGSAPCLDRGLAARPQRARLAYAARVLRVGRHTDRRRGRGVRSAASERSPAAWHEGHDERDGAVAFPPALARSPEAEGAAR